MATGVSGWERGQAPASWLAVSESRPLGSWSGANGLSGSGSCPALSSGPSPSNPDGQRSLDCQRRFWAADSGSVGRALRAAFPATCGLPLTSVLSDTPALPGPTTCFGSDRTGHNPQSHGALSWALGDPPELTGNTFVAEHSRNQLQTLGKASRDLAREPLPWELGNLLRLCQEKGRGRGRDPLSGAFTHMGPCTRPGTVLPPGLRSQSSRRSLGLCGRGSKPFQGVGAQTLVPNPRWTKQGLNGDTLCSRS